MLPFLKLNGDSDVLRGMGQVRRLAKFGERMKQKLVSSALYSCERSPQGLRGAPVFARWGAASIKRRLHVLLMALGIFAAVAPNLLEAQTCTQTCTWPARRPPGQNGVSWQEPCQHGLNVNPFWCASSCPAGQPNCFEPCGAGFECHSDEQGTLNRRCSVNTANSFKTGICVPVQRQLGIYDSRVVQGLTAPPSGRRCLLRCLSNNLQTQLPNQGWLSTSPLGDKKWCTYSGAFNTAAPCSGPQDVGRFQPGRVIDASPFEFSVWQNTSVKPRSGSCPLCVFSAESPEFCKPGQSFSGLITGCTRLQSGNCRFTVQSLWCPTS